MNPADFNQSNPGRLSKVGRGDAIYWAFIPAPLPPKLEWTDDIVRQLSAADRALGQLAGVGRNLPNPHLLIGPFKRREAVLSSRIEGTQASVSDLLLFEANPNATPRIADVREVANYVEAIEHGLRRLDTLPLSNRLIRELHERLMRKMRGQERTPGLFRTSQNWFGSPGCGINDARYVPPPPTELPDCLTSFENYLHAPSKLPPLVRLAIIHYQFEAIHPFLDGNGRVGRLLITLLLCAESILPGPLLYLSAYFERQRSEYYEGLHRVSTHGAWGDWIEFFLRGVTEQAMDAVGRANRLLGLREAYRGNLVQARQSALLLMLIDALFEHPAMTIDMAAKRMNVTRRAASQHIYRLVDAGMLTEITGRQRGRVYIADEIRSIIE